MLNARTDTCFSGARADAFTGTVERAARYIEAGADCIFVPGVVEEDTIHRLAAAIPGPLNVVAGPTRSTPTLFSLGVKRSAWAQAWPEPHSPCWKHAGRELLGTGTLEFLDGAISSADLQRRFSP